MIVVSDTTPIISLMKAGQLKMSSDLNDLEIVVLSERPEDQLKAVEWAREQKKKILDDKSKRIADALMEKMTPLILKNSVQK